MLPGRVTLAAGRQRLAGAAGGSAGAGWSNLPHEVGLDTAGMLQAAAQGSIRTLVLLGADPLGDFRDTTLARQALESVDNLIAVDTVLNPSTVLASVVLPAAGFTEVAGTTTNLEGRVSVLNQKVTPPGTSRSDWIIAAELAMAMGADLQLESVEGIRDEIERVAPSHTGLTTDVLESPAAADGVVVPMAGATVGIGPEAFTPPPPRPLAPNDSYSLRIVATRKLYDEGVAVQTSPSLASLAPGSVLRVNRYDFERLGVSEGDLVRVTSHRAVREAAIQIDDTVPRGSAGIWFNQPGLRAGDLIDASSPVATVQVETLGGGASAS
jgi:NADH-quinone oxidoreductase subunit G